MNDWFVYLFALTDCSAFKVGFSCNPLQRIYTFSPRYFERFDLQQSRLLLLDDCEQARAGESLVKSAFAEHRVAAPTWVPAEAGGHTEWFSAVYLAEAEERLSDYAQRTTQSALLPAAQFLREALERQAPSFERWSYAIAQRIREDTESMSLGYDRTLSPHALRDWFDAYHHFDVPLFREDRRVLDFVSEIARTSI